VDCILTLDAGSSSVRTLLFGFDGKQIPGFGSQLRYHAHTTTDGAWEIDPAEFVRISTDALGAICQELRDQNLKPAAVAVDTFWHSLIGLDAANEPTTPILHPFDTRSAADARELSRRINNRAQHKRTGAVLHSSYPAAKLLWLCKSQPDNFRRTQHWMSAGEFLFLKLLGKPAASTSMLSATGLWNQAANDYDEEILSALPISRAQLADPHTLDQPVCSSCPWPELSNIPWFPALGDGACDNVGSGCTTEDRFALMVGTSGAMRAVIDQRATATRPIDIPEGLFCYRVDPKRLVIGGALSNGGEVFAWMKQTLRLPDSNQAIESQLSALSPGQHGLSMLPFLAGERSTGWRPDARAAIIGLAASTSPIDILQAALESVALRFRNVCDLMQLAISPPREIIASGAALLHSNVWTQMIADTLGHSLIQCIEPEATSRGAALLALERLGAIKDPGDIPVQYGTEIEPIPGNTKIYEAAVERQRRLYHKLFEEN
jgi:gluconokinase